MEPTKLMGLTRLLQPQDDSVGALVMRWSVGPDGHLNCHWQSDSISRSDTTDPVENGRCQFGLAS